MITRYVAHTKIAKIDGAKDIMTPEQIIAIYGLGQWARTTLADVRHGNQEQRCNVERSIGIIDKMLAEAGYPGHTQVVALMDQHWPESYWVGNTPRRDVVGDR